MNVMILFNRMALANLHFSEVSLIKMAPGKPRSLLAAKKLYFKIYLHTQELYTPKCVNCHHMLKLSVESCRTNYTCAYVQQQAWNSAKNILTVDIQKIAGKLSYDLADHPRWNVLVSSHMMHPASLFDL